MNSRTLPQVNQARQLPLIPEIFPDLLPDIDGEHGEVFTRKWVVELILDLVGYTIERDLAGFVAVEPACGTGAFLGPLIERLSASCKRYGRPLTDARNALRAYDLLPRNLDQARSVALKVLRRDGWPQEEIEEVTADWLHVGDYLLMLHDDRSVDFVVGNPPYIRIEDVPEARMHAYRETCKTMIGRADIFVGFFEVALASLRADGRLGFICADRWMRNQYGRVLRKLIADRYDLEAVISMHDVDAFEEQVSAYPAITVIHRGHQGAAIVADTTARFGAQDAPAVLKYIRSGESEIVANDRYEIARLLHWFDGDESWPAGNPKQLAILEHLTDKFPALEDVGTGTRVGIGVATGADGVFVTKTPPDIEADRLLPLAMVRDLATGKLEWSGHYLVNPWTENGALVRLTDYPRLARYFDEHGAQLKKRHIAEKFPVRWYRTIDNLNSALTGRAKLLIPDMRLTIHPVLDEGKTYPHHNLYYVVSDTWDMRVLGGLLLSRVAQAFIQAYAVKMRGGTLRFQAQYLRRIRVPRQSDLTERDRQELTEAFDRRDVDGATSIALRLYGLEDLAR
jgi:adenine-specific DNA-methyltransferase